MYQKYFKRFFDIIVSLILIFILSPIMIIIFFVIWLKIGFPVYTQYRPGLKNKIFKLYKFKTLYDDDSLDIIQRQSKIGNFLRKTGLDELPQLFNVISNSMSLVGPRPLLIEYLDKFSEYEKKRHLVRPGITGLAQVLPSRNGLKLWKKSLRLDIFYVSKISFLLDLKIIWRTFKLIFNNKKLYQDFKRPF